MTQRALVQVLTCTSGGGKGERGGGHGDITIARSDLSNARLPTSFPFAEVVGSNNTLRPLIETTESPCQLEFLASPSPTLSRLPPAAMSRQTANGVVNMGHTAELVEAAVTDIWSDSSSDTHSPTPRTQSSEESSEETWLSSKDAYRLCLDEIQKRDTGFLHVKTTFEAATGDLESFFDLVLDVPEFQERHARIKDLMYSAGAEECEAQAQLVDVDPGTEPKSKGAVLSSDESYTFCLKLFKSGNSFRKIGAIASDRDARIHDLISVHAHGPGHAWRPGAIMLMLIEAIIKDHSAHARLMRILDAKARSIAERGVPSP